MSDQAPVAAEAAVEKPTVAELARLPEKPVVPGPEKMAAEAVVDYGKAEQLIEKTAETAGMPIDVPEAEGIIARIRREHKEKTTQKELQRRFDYLTSNKNVRNQIGYGSSVGVAWGSTEKLAGTLETGMSPGERAVNCNVVVMWGKNGHQALMHVSPATMPEDFQTVYADVFVNPANKDVDKKLEKMKAVVGEAESVQIIGGDPNLTNELETYLTTGQNIWGKDGRMITDGRINKEKIQKADLGVGGKQVVTDPEYKRTLVKDHTRGIITELKVEKVKY